MDPGILEGEGGRVLEKAGPYRNFQTDKQQRPLVCMCVCVGGGGGGEGSSGPG